MTKIKNAQDMTKFVREAISAAFKAGELHQLAAPIESLSQHGTASGFMFIRLTDDSVYHIAVTQSKWPT